MKYYRPETIEEALGLLAEGIPLAGGTTLAPKRRTLEAVIDLDRVGLDEIKLQDDEIRIGAAAKLQRLLHPELDLPVDFKRGCRLEAAWNLRNMATLGGAIMSADARSPLLVNLLALHASASISGEAASTAVDELLDRRKAGGEPFLIEQVVFEIPAAHRYEYVARAPTDRPLVSASAAIWDGGARLGLAIGGFGDRPLVLDVDADAPLEEITTHASAQYAESADAFASADYRSEVAAILVGRVVKEVRS